MLWLFVLVFLPRYAVGWPEVCDCGNSWSYSTTLCDKFCFCDIVLCHFKSCNHLAEQRPCLEVIKLEFILKLKIKRKQPIIALHCYMRVSLCDYVLAL